MINIKKGAAHSLEQTDKTGNAKANEGVEAGMLVRVDSTGDVVKGPSSQSGALDELLGFAINNQTDGDVVESGKIGIYLLDGGSVIETDQSDTTINASNYVIGARVAPDPTHLGKVRPWESGDRVIGYVEGIRTLPTTPAVPASITADPAWPTTSMLGIKLAV